MAIERGRDWGWAGSLPAEAVEASDDAAVAAAVERRDTYVRPTGGDLARTLGVSPASLGRETTALLPIDAMRVRIDDGPAQIAIAHVIIGPSRRPVVAAMNAAFRGAANLAPRAHPGDGRLDIVTFRLARVDWIKARSRLATGAHVPHPGISIERASTWEQTFDRPRRVRIDDVSVGRATSVRLEVLADAIIVGV